MSRRWGALLVSSAAVALTLAGCAGGAGSTPVPSVPSEVPSAPSDPSGAPSAAWMDDGRAVALVTWGSSSCPPVMGDAITRGQEVTVVIEEPPAETVCTADLAPRASLVTLPAGVDPAQDLTIIAKGADVDAEVTLAGDATLTGTPGESTEFRSSAGWYDSLGIVLLTWGSSSCPPIVEGIDEKADGATVTFRDEDRVCTRDMAPRTTVLDLGHVPAETAGYTLTLTGGGLDGTVPVVGR